MKNITNNDIDNNSQLSSKKSHNILELLYECYPAYAVLITVALMSIVFFISDYLSKSSSIIMMGEYLLIIGITVAILGIPVFHHIKHSNN